MKTLIIAVALLASGAAHAGYGIDAQGRALNCTGSTIRQAVVNGDFSKWVLPGFIPGKHLRAGQWLDEHCGVQGAPS